MEWNEWRRSSTSSTPGTPTEDAARIYGAALVLLEQAWERGRPVRVLDVGGDRLTPPTVQLQLF